MPNAHDEGKPEGTAAPFKDHFSVNSQAYAQARPGYPPALFEWLAGQTPRRDCAWDCATGNGQAARALAEHFSRVIATDASAEQIGNAVAHPRIEYRVAAAEAPELDPGSVDLVTVAQAVHWFDLPRFYAAVRTVLKPGGVIALWTYDLLTITPALDAPIRALYRGPEIGPWWPPERQLVDEHYTALDFPFAEIEAPAFHMRQSWTFEQVLAYLATWSGVSRYRRDTGRDPIAAMAPELKRCWGDVFRREVSWPFFLRVGSNI